MIFRISSIAVVIAFLMTLGTGCATKKYARDRINERVAPLEQRTGELEETSRRNSQEIGRLDQNIQDVRGRADRAQSQADSALSKAEQANSRNRSMTLEIIWTDTIFRAPSRSISTSTAML